jgi:hypothetical protein
LMRIIGTKNQQSKILAANSFLLFALAPLCKPNHTISHI